MQGEEMVKIVRETESVCPVCLDAIPAYIIKKKETIYLEKSCETHGKFGILISQYPKDYLGLNNFYFNCIPDKMHQKEYYLSATNQCNIGCPICFLKYQDNAVSELSLDNVNKISQIKGVKRFTFSHGEPTTNDELLQMIKILKRSHKVVDIHTNGVKVADFSYALLLKSTGLDHISLQFDGFDEETYIALRGIPLLEKKLKALNNLKKLSIPVTLNVTIAKGVNEHEVGRIFDYVLREKFIKDISFVTYSHYNPEKKDMNRYILPDELLLHIENSTAGKISREDIILFQKLFFSYISVFGKRKCFYYYHFLIMRTLKGYFSIGELINLSKAAAKFDFVINNKRRLTRLRFIIILLSSLKIKSLFLLPYVFSVFARGGYPGKPIRLLAITFATICDPYKYDSSIARNCGQGIITNDNIHDSYGRFLMEEMQETRLKQPR